VAKAAKKYERQSISEDVGLKCDKAQRSFVKHKSHSEGTKQREHCIEVGNDVKRWGTISEGFLKESIKRKGDA
jgi:hypothetical protein